MASGGSQVVNTIFLWPQDYGYRSWSHHFVVRNQLQTWKLFWESPTAQLGIIFWKIKPWTKFLLNTLTIQLGSLLGGNYSWILWLPIIKIVKALLMVAEVLWSRKPLHEQEVLALNPFNSFSWGLAILICSVPGRAKKSIEGSNKMRLNHAAWGDSNL